MTIKIEVSWGDQRLKEAVFEKFVRYNRKGFEGKIILDYKLVYKNGETIRYIPCSTTNFMIKPYKEDLGTDYNSILVYLLECELEDDEEDIELYLPSVLASR